ncbi:21550_t:CDS:2, partial [Dentiscutata erythropus]
PYKKVIPENLYEDLMAYFMSNILNPKISRLPSRHRYIIRIDSVIIKGDDAAIISDWIEKRTNFSEKPLYQFILTYRATRDGFNYNKFINKNCNGWKAVNNNRGFFGGPSSGFNFGANNNHAFNRYFGGNNNHAFNRLNLVPITLLIITIVIPLLVSDGNKLMFYLLLWKWGRF